MRLAPWESYLSAEKIHQGPCVGSARPGGPTYRRKKSVNVSCCQKMVKRSQEHINRPTRCWEFKELIWTLKLSETWRTQPREPAYPRLCTPPTPPFLLQTDREKRVFGGWRCWSEDRGLWGGVSPGSLNNKGAWMPLWVQSPNCYQRAQRSHGHGTGPAVRVGSRRQAICKIRKRAEAQLTPKLPSHPGHFPPDWPPLQGSFGSPHWFWNLPPA